MCQILPIKYVSSYIFSIQPCFDLIYSVFQDNLAELFPVYTYRITKKQKCKIVYRIKIPKLPSFCHQRSKYK